MHLILITVALLLGNSCATAQSRIDKIVEELEEEGCDVNKVVKRDPKTKQVYSTVKSLTFYSKDSKYANRLKEAFKKDAENAATETVSNHGNNYTLIFRDGKKRATYTLRISADSNSKVDKLNPLVRLSIVIKDGDSSDFDWGTLNLDGIESIRNLGEFDWNNRISDSDIMTIVQQAQREGLSHAQIVTKLLQKGVKIDQIRRLRGAVQKADSVRHAKRKEAEAIAKAKRP